jgi:hypothetical protein
VSDNKPPSFELGGRSWTLRPKIPWQLVEQAALGLTGGVAEMVRTVKQMLVYSVCKAQRAEFITFLDTVPEEDDDVFDFEDVLAAFQEVASRASRAPFQPSSDSPGSLGLRNTGSPSGDGSSSTGLTSAAFAPTTQ